jgi:hypothetical protein
VLVNWNVHDGELHHVAAVKDGSRYYEYLDGLPIASDSGPPFGTPATGDPPIQMGAMTTGVCAPVTHQLNGVLDEVARYDRALSAWEVAMLAQRPEP